MVTKVNNTTVCFKEVLFETCRKQSCYFFLSVILALLEMLVCLSVCEQHYSKSYERTVVGLYGGVHVVQ